MVITGDNFGPSFESGNQLDIVVTYGPTSNALQYSAIGCNVTKAHTEITCITAEGTGSFHFWTVSVAGQSRYFLFFSFSPVY